MISSKTKIGLLVAGHVVAELVLAWAAKAAATFPIVRFGLFALVIAEAGLLGMWGGVSAIRIVIRLFAVLVATLYLWAVFVAPIREDVNYFLIFLLIALTTLPILVVLVVLRHCRRKLRLAHLANKFPSSEGFQFSIRHVLIATALVASVLGIGRGVRNISNRQSELVAVATFPPCFIMVELATLWAALGLGRPLPRLAVVVPTAFVVGAIPSFYLPGPTDLGFWVIFIWPAIIGLQATITACSLLVFRSCGWRLVSGPDGIEPLPAPPGP